MIGLRECRRIPCLCLALVALSITFSPGWGAEDGLTEPPAPALPEPGTVITDMVRGEVILSTREPIGSETQA